MIRVYYLNQCVLIECMEDSNTVTPFVMKTYQMVSDPTTNGLITWATANNSFIVLEPSEFSHRILPLYFKHNNFSSFVRQLNTYGFRKVDPDRWEFANEWFLRGQTQLLNNIVRRKHNTRTCTSLVDDDDEVLLMEIAKLQQEQKSLEQEVESMNRRLEATERRPQQMMSFLYKLVEDPQILTRQNRDKKRKIILSCAYTCSSSSGMAMSSSSDTTLTQTSSPQGNLNAETPPSLLEISSPPDHDKFTHRHDEHGDFGNDGCGVYTNYFEGLQLDSPPPAPYPFSLLGAGFWTG